MPKRPRRRPASPHRLDEVLPHCREQAKVYAEMAKDGYISKLAKEDYYECYWKPWSVPYRFAAIEYA